MTEEQAMLETVLEELAEQDVFCRELDGNLYIVDGQVDMKELIRAVLGYK